MAVGSTDTTQTQSVHTGGITVGIGGKAADMAQSVYGDARRSGAVTDARLTTLYAAKAAYEAKDLAYLGQKAYQGAGDSNPDGINLKVGIGGSTASSRTATHDEASYGSAIRSAGDVTIAATHGDLDVIGSRIDGQNVALAASHDLNLRSQAEQHTLTSTNKNASGGVGLQIGTDGIGFYAEASVGKGKAHGNGSTHTGTVVSAADTLRLVAGHDATIQGAQAQGDTVLADVGHDLAVTSEQDTGDYASTQWQASGKVVVGMGASVSGSASYGKVDSHYASVTQASGLQAGDGGYQVTVGGTTHLVGGQLASTADPARNRLDTGSLIAESVHNVSKYDALSVSVSGGSGGMGGGGLSKQNHDASSDTRSGIAAGTVTIRDGDIQGELNRNQATLEANGVKDGFDAQKIANQQELGQVAGYVGMRSVGALADHMANQATTEAEQQAWRDGGANKVLLHGLVGAATAALGGGDAAQGALGASASAAASGVMADYLADHGIDPNGAKGKVLMELASAAIGGAAGGVNGASTALQGEQYNRQLHPSEQQLAQTLAAKSGGRFTTQQVEDAMRLSGYSLGAGSVMPGETSLTGSDVDVKDSGAIYDTHASWALEPGPNGGQHLIQQVPDQVSPDLAAYIIASTGGANSPYAWAREQQGMSPGAVAVGNLNDWVSSNQVGTRALGGLQMVGGALEFTGG
ncbi:MAG: hemagglutinin repeat-containing protein, partial [Rhodanobacter sp.]|nr:hemagglutinin repeat-containing protein [Rhodanobacter sp.]